MTQAHEERPGVEVAVNAEGRLTIPAQVRRAAGIEPGQAVVVYVEDGRIVIEQRAHLLARIRAEAQAARVATGHTGSVVDEFIAERRAEAAREEAE
jgi:AbrB family looped-hinge helix DNA binding protein